MNAQPEHVEIAEDDFEAQYRVLDTPDGDNVWTVRPPYPENQIWSVVDCDGDLYLLPGYHWVNRIGYIVTQEPWPHENVTAEWFVGHEDEGGES